MARRVDADVEAMMRPGRGGGCRRGLPIRGRGGEQGGRADGSEAVVHAESCRKGAHLLHRIGKLPPGARPAPVLYSPAVHTPWMPTRHPLATQEARCLAGLWPPTRSPWRWRRSRCSWPDSAGSACTCSAHRVSVTSGARILLAALVILLVRHAIRRDQPVFLRAWRTLGRWWGAESVRAVDAGVGGIEAGGAAGRVPGRGDVRLS